MKLMIYWNNKAAEISVQMFRGGGGYKCSVAGVGSPLYRLAKTKGTFPPR